MNRAGVAAVLAAVLVVLAGCSAGLTGGSATPTDAGSGDGSGDAADGDGGVGADDSDGTGEAIAGSSGSVNFYVSDRPGAIEDFEHLNVTVTTVKFHLVERAGNGSSSAGGTNPTANTTTVATANGTATPTENVTADGNGPEAGTETDGDGDEPETEREEEGRDDDGDGEDGRWVVREVNATTVDLTRLRGANATLVDEFDVPAGEYDRVVLEVSEVNATLTDGESARVKLPSEKLQLDTGFEVANGSEVDFVYDVMVHKAGKSGKYILRPVLSESGTDQPIERVDERGRPVDGERGERGDEERGDEERGDDERGDSEREREGSLAVRLGGDPVAGGNVTVRVADANGSVANATVTVNGERAGTTGADGTLAVGVPADAEELEIEIEAGDREGELERELDDSGDGEGDRDAGPPEDGSGDGNPG